MVTIEIPQAIGTPWHCVGIGKTASAAGRCAARSAALNYCHRWRAGNTGIEHKVKGGRNKKREMGNPVSACNAAIMLNDPE